MTGEEGGGMMKLEEREGGDYIYLEGGGRCRRTHIPEPRVFMWVTEGG